MQVILLIQIHDKEAERILTNDEHILTLVKAFKKRSIDFTLPGFGENTLDANISKKIFTLDQQFIKFILNKRLDGYERKKYRILRIYLSAENKSQESLTLYKTIGVKGHETIQTALESAMKKYNIMESTLTYDLFSSISGKGKVYSLWLN
jgi:hypothetical protein